MYVMLVTPLSAVVRECVKSMFVNRSFDKLFKCYHELMKTLCKDLADVYIIYRQKQYARLLSAMDCSIGKFNFSLTEYVFVMNMFSVMNRVNLACKIRRTLLIIE